jgi:hypothetical protein|tara:strand:- start:4436 stop:4678 length:243 start_codon:yes stop_codon:yes gene_type:complete
MYPYYEFDQDHYEGRYYNTNGKGIAIVAAVTKGIDWAAYIGADDGWHESDCLDWAAKHGAKLSEQDARHFFPAIELPYRR